MDNVVCIECTVKAASDHNARSIFQLASNRLLHAHEWSRLTDSLLSTSEHRDMNGSPVSRPVETDDYINLTDQEQRPYGWLQVLEVVQSNEGQEGEVAVLALPVEVPFEGEKEGERTPTLLRVVRRGLDVTAALIIETNPLTPVFERLGVYMVQWRSLVNGLLSDLTPIEEKIATEAIGLD
jgi:hypothetical protein